MPWHLFSAPGVIHYTLDTLGAAIGPLYGILVADYFILKHEQLFVDDLYSDKPDGQYWYRGGFNPAAVQALIAGFLAAMLFVFIPQLFFLASFSWGIGALVGSSAYVWLMRRSGIAEARAARCRLRTAGPASGSGSRQR
jgi:NCS1 family nucleobase:cation symporter-1